MSICSQCEAQAKKSRNGKPHEDLAKIGEMRIYTGQKPRRFEEQDYQCQKCRARFTQSTNANDLAWTLWQS